MAAAAPPLQAQPQAQVQDLRQRQRQFGNFLKAVTKNKFDAECVAEPGADMQDVLGWCELVASQIEENPDTVTRIAEVIGGATLDTAVLPGTHAEVMVLLLRLAQRVAPDAKQWAVNMQDAIGREQAQVRQSRAAQEVRAQVAIELVNDIAGVVGEDVVASPTIEQIGLVAISLYLLLRAAARTVNCTLKLSGKGEVAKISGWTGGILLGAGACAAGLFTPFVVTGALLASPGFICAVGGIALGSGTTVGSGVMLGVGVKDGIKRRQNEHKTKEALSALDLITRSVIGYMCFLHNIETHAEAQNSQAFIKLLRTLNKAFSLPVGLWTAPAFKESFLRQASEDLEDAVDELSQCLGALGVKAEVNEPA